MVRESRATRRAEIEVMPRRIEWDSKRLSARDSEVATVFVPQSTQPSDAGLQATFRLPSVLTGAVANA